MDRAPAVTIRRTAGSSRPVAALTAAVNAVGAFPFDAGSGDAAVLVTLPAGANYTVQVSGKNSTAGTVLVEFYLLP